jgi:NAD(P)-dependent dehydrogenase (short-subunit alcohol dehydrogenase family)
MRMKGVAGKVAVVTGSGRGLGRSTALALANGGAKVVINDPFVNDEGSVADAVVAEIKASGGTAVADQHSVADFDGCAGLIETAVKTFGRVDVLVLCAGNSIKGPLDSLTEELLDLSLAVHVKGHFGCIKAAVPHMIEQGDGGRIITFASRGAFHNSTAPAYAASKAAIMGLTAHFALSLAEHNITVNCMIPSADTQLFPGSDPVARSRKWTNWVGELPVSTNMSPDYIAPVVAYLASEEAEHITGKFVYSSGADIAFYPQPLGIQNGGVLARTAEKWTLEDLDRVVPALLNRG